MNAAALVVTLSAMGGASVAGIVAGFLAGRRNSRDTLAASASLVKSLEELSAKQHETIESQASRDVSEDRLRDTLMAAQESNTASIKKLIEQRDRFAREAGYKVTP